MKLTALACLLLGISACADTTGVSSYSGESVTVTSAAARFDQDPSVIQQANTACAVHGRRATYVATNDDRAPHKKMWTWDLQNMGYDHIFACV
jgi:hypothetical protein